MMLLAEAVAQDGGHYYVLQMETCQNRTTLHGLWPQWGEWCDAPPFDPKALAPVAAELERWWPSCAGTDNATAFHAHEWDKHGSCTPFTELQYFSTALQLRARYAPTGQLRVCLDGGLLQPTPCPKRASP